MINIEKIKLLPNWVITDKYPAFYDTESATAIEQTAKLYGAMRELQESYNKFVASVNTTITAFINDVNADQEEFECKITKIVHDYIAMLDEKIKQQDQVIEDSIIYVKNNIEESATEIINQAITNGKIAITHTYDETTKKVSLVIGGTV